MVCGHVMPLPSSKARRNNRFLAGLNLLGIRMERYDNMRLH